MLPWISDPSIGWWTPGVLHSPQALPRERRDTKIPESNRQRIMSGGSE